MVDTNADTLRRAADLAAITKACEEAYADASREGYVDNPAVIAAVAGLKDAHAALVTADADINTACAGVSFLDLKGFFRGTAAAWRADRALRVARTAYVRLRAAITRAGEKNLLKMGFDAEWISGVKALAQMQK